MMQTAVMGAKYRSGFRLIYNLWIDGTRGRKSGKFYVVLIILRDVSRLDLLNYKNENRTPTYISGDLRRIMQVKTN